MKKQYKSKSQVSINIKVGAGHAHISFTQQMNGGSVYYTEDEEVQKGLETHPRYGKLFKFAGVIEEKAEEETPKSATEDKGDDAVTVHVTDINEAKDYLCEHYGVSRTKLRSAKAIEAEAAARGIKFVTAEEVAEEKE